MNSPTSARSSKARCAAAAPDSRSRNPPLVLGAVAPSACPPHNICANSRFNFKPPRRHCEPPGRRKAPPGDRLQRSNPELSKRKRLDCFVASLLAMTALFQTARSSTPEVNKTRSWLRPTGENFVLRRLAHGVVDQCLAARPDRAGDLVTGGDDGIERRLDPVAILLGDGQRRQQLDG